MTEFLKFSKIPRLFRDATITEKIDGTNAQVFISDGIQVWPSAETRGVAVPDGDGGEWYVMAGSRTRWITPEQDNHGFARWVWDNAAELVKLGPGHHFGEWWGSGINRGYGLPKGQKRFSLFNTKKWSDPDVRPKCCDVVPVMYEGPFSLDAVTLCLAELEEGGSIAQPYYMNPEGVVVYHHAANQCFKATIENDEGPKGLAA